MKALLSFTYLCALSCTLATSLPIYAQQKLRDRVGDIYNRYKPLIKGDSATIITPKQREEPVGDVPRHALYMEWARGKVPEFSTAYTLRRHEFRLNILGPSSYALSDKLELKSYLSAVVVPNISLKKKFFDNNEFAFAWEFGAAAGAFPLAGITGILMPGGAIAGGTAGLLNFNSLFVKGYGSWKPSRMFTFSLRSEVERLHLGYTGLGGFAAIGSGGAGAGVLLLNTSLANTYWVAGGFESDFVINPKQAIVLRASMGKFLTTGLLGENTSRLSSDFLLFPSLSWNHAWERRHIHLSLGLFGTYNPPSYTLNQKNVLPVMYYYNVYWIFHNKARTKSTGSKR